ncbi:hypothetical protein ACFR97_04675 [Haloplanus litoreus]|uniref:Uncharacterized protein n=1 Tax=Haloplanus litoreus TaxID=767515 RepID=A0ABD6A154_9EURY
MVLVGLGVLLAAVTAWGVAGYALGAGLRRAVGDVRADATAPFGASRNGD